MHFAIGQLRSAVAEQAYLSTGLDYSRPTSIMANINEVCNYRCPMCMHWRPEFARHSELSVDQWKNALASLREFLGSYLIAFLGGEPFIKPGFLDILEYCHESGISFTTTTNGSLLLRGDTIRRLVNAAPVHLNISVDGPTADIHDRSRGVAGAFEKIEHAIHAIRAEQQRTGQHFPIRIKPTVHLWNFRSMPSMVEWVQRIGADTVDFEPMREWTTESIRDMWIGPNQINDLDRVIQELIAQKRAGAPIETSERRLTGMPNHFGGGNVEPEVTPCRVGLRRFAIAPNGDVTTCWFYDPIGNMVQQSARDIWTGAVGRRRRQETVACKKACAYSCMAQKPLKNLFERGQLLLAAERKRTALTTIAS